MEGVDGLRKGVWKKEGEEYGEGETEEDGVKEGEDERDGEEKGREKERRKVVILFQALSFTWLAFRKQSSSSSVLMTLASVRASIKASELVDISGPSERNCSSEC